MGEFRSWWDFIRFMDAVHHTYRYVHTDEARVFLETLVETSAKRHRIFNTNEVLWRAQLGGASRKRGLDEVVVEHPTPYQASRMKPLQNAANEGRVNPKGIPVLYLATDMETAMAEVRPWVGSHISLGRFKVTRTLTVIDFSTEDNTSLGFYAKEPDPARRTSIVWAQIGQLFSKPISNDPSTAEYAPTQIIAEMFRQRGFDGVAYKSSLGPGLNVAFFSLEAADLVTRSLHEVESISFAFRKVGSTRRGKRDKQA